MFLLSGDCVGITHHPTPLLNYAAKIQQKFRLAKIFNQKRTFVEGRLCKLWNFLHYYKEYDRALSVLQSSTFLRMSRMKQALQDPIGLLL